MRSNKGVLGLFYGGGLSQFWAELIGVTDLLRHAGSAGSRSLYSRSSRSIVGNRVSEEVEIEGLDIPEMGVHRLLRRGAGQGLRRLRILGRRLTIKSVESSPRPIIEAKAAREFILPRSLLKKKERL